MSTVEIVSSRAKLKGTTVSPRYHVLVNGKAAYAAETKTIAQAIVADHTAGR